MATSAARLSRDARRRIRQTGLTSEVIDAIEAAAASGVYRRTPDGTPVPGADGEPWSADKIAERLLDAQDKLESTPSTLDTYRFASDAFRAERDELRDRWVDELYGNGARLRRGETPRAIIYIGPPGAGKSAAVAGTGAAIEIDADAFKKLMPE